MSTPFQNSIVGQQGTLVRSQIKSPNFSQLGQTGWAILKNGSAFFFNITATGTITATTFVGTDFFLNSSGAYWYSAAPGTGDLIASITSSPGPNGDGHGNTTVGTIASYANPSLAYSALVAGELLLGSLNPSSTATSASTLSATTSTGTTDAPQVALASATADNTTGFAVVQCIGGSQDGLTALPLVRLQVGPSPGANDTVEFDYNGHIFRIGAGTTVGLSVTGNANVSGTGTFGGTIAAAPFSSSIGTASNSIAEAVIGTINIPAGDANSFSTAYQWKIAGNINAAAAMNVTLRMRIGGLAGPTLATFGPFTVRGLIVGMAFAIDGNAMCRSAGAGGHFDSWTYCAEQIVAAASAVHADQTQFVAQDTTVAYTIVLTAQMSVANAGNQAQTQEVNCVRFSH